MDSHPYWSSLPIGLLLVIIDHLQFADQARFAAVCTWWRNAAGHSTHLPALRFPWLLLPNDLPTATWDLFSPMDDVGARIRLLSISIPWASGCRCFGSSKGWLFMSHYDYDIRLLNPFTNTHYPLPYGSHRSYPQWKKAILSSSPSPQTVVAALHGARELITLRLGDVEWATHGIHNVKDFIFVEGILYCLTVGGGGDQLVVSVYEFTPHFRRREIYKPPPQPNSTNGADEAASYYLVGGRGGELLAVVRHWDENPIPDSYFKATLGFSVLKLLDRGSAPRWVEVDSLGDEMIFVGTASSACFAAPHGGGFRRNCIYFTDDRPGMRNPIISTTVYADCDWGEYCLDDRSFKRFPLDSSYTTRSPPCWYLLT